MKLRWLVTPKYTPTNEEIKDYQLVNYCGIRTAINELTTPETRVLQYQDEWDQWQDVEEEVEVRSPSCSHEWVDARNEIVMSGEVCLKCHGVRAGNET